MGFVDEVVVGGRRKGTGKTRDLVGGGYGAEDSVFLRKDIHGEYCSRLLRPSSVSAHCTPSRALIED